MSGGGEWADMLSHIGLKPGDTSQPARASSSAAPSAPGGPSQPSSSSSFAAGVRQPVASGANPAGPNRAGYWREGSSYTRDREAAAEAAARPFTFKDEEGEWTRETYRDAYSAAQDGGGTFENARPGFQAGYMSVPDADLARNAQRRINEPSIPVPREPPGMKWKKIESGHTGPQSLEEAEWVRQAAEWRSAGQNTAEEDEERRARAAERREDVGRRAEAEWRSQQRANEASAAEARREATRVEDEDFELQIALAVSASAASGDRNAQLLAELELEEHRKASGAQGEVGRSRGQALAARYWISCCLDTDEELTEDADGFYDLWGDYTEAEENEHGRCPTLRALLELDGGTQDQGREALLVDRRSDIVLAELCESVKQGANGRVGETKTLEVRAAWLALLVCRHMGGPVGPAELPDLEARWAIAASELRASGRGGVMRIGELPVGLQRHRVLLYKALAPCIGVKCRMLKGSYYCGSDDGAKIVIDSNGQDVEVDLMGSPGKLRKSLTSQPTRPPPSHTQSMPSFHPGEAPAGGPRGSEHSGRATAAGAAAAAAAAAAGAQRAHPQADQNTEEDVLAAELMSQHNVALEDAFDAIIRSDGDLTKAHILCQAASILGLRTGDVYDLLVLSGWELERAVTMAMDAAEDTERASAADRERRERDRRRAYEPPPPPPPQRASQPYASMPQARPPPAAAPQRQPRAQPAAPAASNSAYSFNRPNVPAYSAQRPPAAPQAARSAAPQQYAARPGMTEAEQRAQTQASERLREIREQARRDQKEAESADTIRRRFHQEWDKKVAAMDLPSILRAFGVPLAGGATPPAAAVRKAYRDALLRFHPDRQRDKSLTERIRAEEMFKLITSKMEAYHGT